MSGRLFRYLIRTLNILLPAIFLAGPCLAITARNAAAFEEQICDITADYALGREDYSASIALHRQLLRSHPTNALAHYHLGFAYGMTGQSSEEISEYREAASLGLHQWALFLNLGVAYLEQQDYAEAVNALETAVLLEPAHPEAHFNLAMAYEKAGRLGDAMKEIVAALQISPTDLDVRNTKAIICAESGDLRCAHDEWALLLQMAPNYAPARTNLAILTGTAQEPPTSSPNMAEIPQLLASASSSSDGVLRTPITNQAARH